MAGIPGKAWNPLDVEETTDDQTVTQMEEWYRRQDDLDQAYLTCFSTPAGRVILEDMKSRAFDEAGFETGLGLINGIAAGFAKQGVMNWIKDIENRMKRAEEGRQNNG